MAFSLTHFPLFFVHGGLQSCHPSFMAVATGSHGSLHGYSLVKIPMLCTEYLCGRRARVEACFELVGWGNSLRTHFYPPPFSRGLWTSSFSSHGVVRNDSPVTPAAKVNIRSYVTHALCRRVGGVVLRFSRGLGKTAAPHSAKHRWLKRVKIHSLACR